MKAKLRCVLLASVVSVSCGSGGETTEQNRPDAGAATSILDSLVNSIEDAEFSDLVGEINMLGVVGLTVTQPPGPVFGTSDIFTSPVATFRQLDTPLSKHAMGLLATAAGENKTIGCTYLEQRWDWKTNDAGELYPELTQAKTALEQLIGDYENSNISAGDKLTISSSDGSIVPMIPLSPSVGGNYYGADLKDNWPGWPSTGTVITIPGDIFPATNAAPVSTVEPIFNLTLSAVEDNSLTGSSVTWTADESGQNSIITLVAMGNGELVCHTPDNGQFTWPAEIDKLGVVDDMIAVRTAFSYQQIDNALLVFKASTMAILSD